MVQQGKETSIQWILRITHGTYRRGRESHTYLMKYKRHTTPSSSKYGRCGATGKVIFRTEGGAKKRIKEILTEESNRCNGYMRAFPCNRCGFWHVTSKSNDRNHQGINDLPKQEHDEIMTAIGHPPEGDGQEHAEIMREITGH